MMLQVDMDKLADSLQKLNEDDLLQVVQMVHDHKAPDSYTKNDIERESFTVRVYPSTLMTFSQLASFMWTCSPCQTR